MKPIPQGSPCGSSACDQRTCRRPARLRRAALALVTLPALMTAGVAGTPAADPERLSPLERLEVHGFVSQGYLYSTGNNYLNDSAEGDSAFTETALNASLELEHDLRLGGQVFLRNLGELGAYEPTLDWAYADWRPWDRLGVRAGRIKQPYGLYNETSDVDAVRTSVLLPQAMYNLEFRDFLVAFDGLDLYGHLPGGKGGSVDYQLFAGRTALDDDGSLARAFNSLGIGAFTVRGLKNHETAGASLIWNTPLHGLRAGLSTTEYASTDVHVNVLPDLQLLGLPPTTTIELDGINLHAFSAEYASGRWLLASEYSRWVGRFLNPFFGRDLNHERMYGQVTRRLNDRVEVGGYYSVLHLDKNHRNGGSYTPRHRGYQKDLAISMRLDISRNWIFKVEAHDVDGTASVLDLDNPGGLERRWRYFATKLSFAF